jgi:hypothetical protein
LEWSVTRSTHLPTSHCLHIYCLPERDVIRHHLRTLSGSACQIGGRLRAATTRRSRHSLHSGETPASRSPRCAAGSRQTSAASAQRTGLDTKTSAFSRVSKTNPPRVQQTCPRSGSRQGAGIFLTHWAMTTLEETCISAR